MLKFILRKTVYRKFSKEEQKTLADLLIKKHINKFFCEIINIFLLVFPFVICLVVSLSERKMLLRTRIALVSCIFLYLVFIGWFLFFFAEEMKEFSYKISSKMYFFFHTRKGNALSKADFVRIAVKNPQLFKLIENGKCQGICYSVCFEMLKILKKGFIKFIAVKNIEPKDGKEYALHVLYVDNDWAFDTYSQRQFPLEKILEIYNAKEYKDLYFEDIRSVSYEQFLYMNGKKIRKWCEEHNVSHKLNPY